MKIVFAAALVALLILPGSVTAQTDFYKNHWSDVYKNEVRDLPKSALKIVDTIYYQAKKDRNVSEITKALLYQSKFALILQENAELYVTQKFRREIDSTEGPLKNVLESMLAQIYWRYFQANRSKYYNRTTVSKTLDPENFLTWDAQGMLREIDRHFALSLANKPMLENTRLEAFDDILALAGQSKKYRPTLYDFLANYALSFYATDELVQTESSAAFNIGRYFSPIDNIDFNDTTVTSGKYKALKLFKELLVFHRQARDTNAYVNLEIERLKFVNEHSTQSDDAELFKDALTKLRAANRNHSASTLVDFELASILSNDGSKYSLQDTIYRWKKKDALKVCDEAITRFPNSDGAKKCYALKEQILSKNLSILAEKFIPASTASRLLITYRNFSHLHFRVYRVTQGFEQRLFLEKSDSLRMEIINRLTPATTFQADLIDPRDYQEHSTELIISALSPGTYLIVASEDEVIGDEKIFEYTTVQSTDLVLLETNGNNIHRFQVVNRINGKPVRGADVHLQSSYANADGKVINEHYLTNKDGFVEPGKLQGEGSWAVVANVSYNGDTVLFQDYHLYQGREQAVEEEGYGAKVFLFTDRSIYRPGQTVFYKGILVKKEKKKSSLVIGESVEVFLEDTNGKEIKSLTMKTNAYGSFSGEFKLPGTGITGEYLLYADEPDDSDSDFYDDLDDFETSDVLISVEEYKGPKFEVTVKPFTGTFKLNDSIRVVGDAIAFSGSKISKAKVSYIIKREVNFPRWYYWRFGNNYSTPAQIGHGETDTDESGQFVVPFKAIPDDEVSTDSKPVFVYSISVEVTDINGETRSAESSVKVGYHSMIANLGMPSIVDMQKPALKATVTTENLNGQFLPAAGTVKVYKLRGPSKPVRKRPWPAPDQPIISKEEFETTFPNESYGNDVSNPLEWPKGKLVKDLLFDTRKSNELSFTIDKTWEVGSYLAELYTTDSTGEIVEDKAIFEVLNSKNTRVPDNSLLIFQTDKTHYIPGELVRLKVGSAFQGAVVTIEIEKDHKIVKTHIEQLSPQTKEITIPVTDIPQTAFSIHCSGVMFNSFVEQHKTIFIERSTEKLSIETETFKDKLQPDSKQTWSFTINGEDGQQRQAEVLASMYDASLDQFKPHEWRLNFNPLEEYSSGYRIGYGQSFGLVGFFISNSPAYIDIPQQNYDALDWFGFSITNLDYIKRKYLQRLYYDADAKPTSTGKPSKVTLSNDRNAPQGFVSGRLTTSDGEALPGVNVIVRGTTRGTATDVHGYYWIEAGKKDVLVFSFIGFVTAEVTVGKKNVVNVSMESDIMQLSEIVIVGYGVQQKKEITGSVSAVKNTTEETGDVVYETLQGRVAGVAIQAAAGQTYKMSIKGMSSLTGDNPPLYVVDGVVVESSKINEEDLMDVQVLKGAAAIAIYGSRAANGAIIITTRSGQQKVDNELAKVNARKNFNETAFFFPHLSTDEAGRIRFSFTTPESLTRWKLQLLGHTKDLQAATKILQAVTQKEMMVTPNIPRFLRAGDQVILSAKIANLSNRKLDGKIVLQLTNPVNGQNVDQLFSNIVRSQVFKTTSKGSTQVSWSIKVPKNVDVLQYKIVAKAGNFSDGEQNALPVLQNRMLVTETMPFYVRSNQTKTFTLSKLQTQSSATLTHHQVTLEVTSNPAWYAIQSLPYLMEFPHECAEQLFSRFYANSIASHIVNSNSKIKEVFDKWAASGQLASDLEKNQELKSIIISETPWVRDAESETEQKKRIAPLFDLALMDTQLTAVTDKLEAMQFSDGAFPWFAGGRYGDRYITQHVASGFGHLVNLKINTNMKMRSMMTRAVAYLDREMVTDFNRILQAAQTSAVNAGGDEKQRIIERYLDSYVPSNLDLHYLYMRSFYPEIIPDEKVKEAMTFFKKQSVTTWRENRLYQKGMIALIQYRTGNKGVAREIMASLRENAIVSEELGMYWKANTPGWYWYESPIETQSLMIEAFAEIGQTEFPAQENTRTIDELRIWLLKNKQANAWKTTKATTEACYALLLNGTDWLPLNKSVDVTLGKNPVVISTTEPEAGTGYFKKSWKKEAVTPGMATVTLSKKDDGVAWGGLYWQYFEDLDNITPADTPLKLKKNVFKVVATDSGEKLNAIKAGDLTPGDLVRVRIELTADREMEYLHMKDMRAAGFEPVDVLSEYQWQEGLGYYQSTRDAATNFFFDRIRKGVYVFEYDLRVNVKGDFSNGITTIQSMYAPEFSSHSEGIRVVVE